MAATAIDVLMFAGGLAILLIGGEALVRGSAAIAARLGISPLIVGITVVGFGTSTPELVTSVEAALVGAPGIALGNIVGSNIANILLVLGVAALTAPVRIDRTMRIHAIGVFATALVFIVLAWAGPLSRTTGLALLGALAVYLTALTRHERRLIVERGAEVTEVAIAGAPAPRSSLALMLAAALGGAVALVVGGHVLVAAALSLAASLGVAPSVIGVTVVAIGTSLPEMVVGVLAALRRHPELALGNILGSNIYNVLGIGGATLVAAPVGAPPHMLAVDLPVMGATSALLLVLAWRSHTLTRRHGGLLVAGYLVFLFLVVAT